MSKPQPSKPPKLMDAEQLSKALGGTPAPATLLRHARRQWIPSLKTGRTVKFHLPSVLAAMQKNAQPQEA